MSQNHQKSTKESPLDSEPYLGFVTECIKLGDMNTTIANKLRKEFDFDTSRDSIRRFRQRHGVQIPGVKKAYTKITGDEAVAQLTPRVYVRDIHEKPILDDPDVMMEERGLDPTKWYIDSIQANNYDGPAPDGNIVTYYQTKFTAKKRVSECILQPVRSDGWKRSTVRTLPLPGTPKLTVVIGDTHAPFHDPNLQRLFCDWLKCNRPHQALDIGDLLDFPDISRHKDDPENMAMAQECMQTGYDLRREQIDASPFTEWIWMPGNHDIRLRNYLIANAPRAAMLRRVDSPTEKGEIVNAVDFLLRTDELGIEFIDPKGPYELAQYNISSKLAARHGWVVRAKGGESAYRSLEKTGYSILVGHTHRQALVQHTVYEIDGTPRQLLAAEIGCMCRLDPTHETRDESARMFPSYSPLPDWQQGFAVVRSWESGQFHISFASYVNNILLWEGQRYE